MFQMSHGTFSRCVGLEAVWGSLRWPTDVACLLLMSAAGDGNLNSWAPSFQGAHVFMWKIAWELLVIIK